MLARIRTILEMIRFSHTLFALPFALSAATMAWLVPTHRGQPIPFRWLDLAGILVCMVTARSAAMAFNRIADRQLDAANPRTANRHLSSGQVSLRQAIAFTVAAAVGFVLGTLLFLPNWLPLVFSVPVLGFLLGYSYAKRFTALAHFWLGAALMMAPIAAWIALRGGVVTEQLTDLMPAAVLGAGVLCWVAGFDIIYACQDASFDVRENLHSVPARWGVGGGLRLAAACHGVMLLILATLPFVEHWGGPPLGLGVVYWSGLTGIALLLLYEHALVRPGDLTRVNTAFFRVNAIISVGLFVVIAADLLVDRWFRNGG